MFFLSFFRIIKFSFQDVYRNIWLSLVTVTILVLALFSINMLLVVKVVGDTAIKAVEERIDISLYLKPDSKESDIETLRMNISNNANVSEVIYVSKAEALEIFREKHKDNPEILQALRELGKNPLTPSLIIKPKSGGSTDVLINDLNKLDNDIVESKDFTDHKTMIKKIKAITAKVSDIGIFVSSIFVFTTLLVVFNSIRVSIYTHRKEITIKRLVGASHAFVYLPFIFSGIIYSILGVGIIMAIFFPFLSILQPYLETFFIGYNINIIEFFKTNIFYIFGIQLLGVAAINIIASWMAVSKYAKV